VVKGGQLAINQNLTLNLLLHFLTVIVQSTVLWRRLNIKLWYSILELMHIFNVAVRPQMHKNVFVLFIFF